MNWQKNVDLYIKIKTVLPLVLFWTLVVPFYRSKGIEFTDIALLQTAGSLVGMLLEIPLGYFSDRFGYRKTLLISSLAFIVGTSLLIVGQNIPLLLGSELFFALALSAQSGADTAILYGSLEQLQRTEEYMQIRAKITQRQSVTRFFVRMIAPILFAQMAALPFLLSLVPYSLVTFFTYQYVELLPERTKTAATVSQSAPEIVSNKLRRRWQAGHNKLVEFFRGNRIFVLLSALSMILLILASNFSQFFAPYLQSLGIDIKFYGFVTASAMLASFLGSRWITLWSKLPAHLVLVSCGGLICLLLIASSLLASPLVVIGFYFCLNFLHTQFNLYLSQSINEVITSDKRATMLSVSNIFDQFGSAICDPIIGFGLERLGFQYIYVIIGLVSLIGMAGLGLLLRKSMQQKSPQVIG